MIKIIVLISTVFPILADNCCQGGNNISADQNIFQMNVVNMYKCLGIDVHQGNRYVGCRLKHLCRGRWMDV